LGRRRQGVDEAVFNAFLVWGEAGHTALDNHGTPRRRRRRSNNMLRPFVDIHGVVALNVEPWWGLIGGGGFHVITSEYRDIAGNVQLHGGGSC
jgi:hypothetical protein